MFGLGKLVEFVGNFLNSEEGQKAVKERVSGWMGFGTADEEIFRTILTALENLHGTAGPIYRKAIEELLAKLNEDQRKRFRIIITSFVLPEVRPTTTFEPTIMRNPDGTPIVEKGKIKIEQKKTEGVLNRIAGTEKDPRIQCLISIAKDWIDCKTGIPAKVTVGNARSIRSSSLAGFSRNQHMLKPGAKQKVDSSK